MTGTQTMAPVSLRLGYETVRTLTEELARPLSAEDQTVQSIPDVSPTKWHRGHTTWFFETFLLSRFLPGYEHCCSAYGYLFNSYYEAEGPRHPRVERGLISRPGVAEVAHYRSHVDEAMGELLDRDLDPDAAWLVELGLHHEQQHQELLLMDIKHVLSCNPLLPAYRAALPEALPGGLPGSDGPPSGHATGEPAPRSWSHPGGLVEVGHAGEGFCFDNETPRHPVYLQPFELASSLVTNGEWLAFLDDGGYRRPELWLSEGWATIQATGWDAPLYWSRADDGWQEFTLSGAVALDPSLPVCHISLFEADAYARWAGARLPTEFEWEAVAAPGKVEGNLLDLGRLHPAAGGPQSAPSFRPFGDVWQWTSSSYAPYPGFRPAPGAVGEYNGKFMVNQYVLRGGCCATPAGHIRASYRNFFPAAARWPFTGVRLARSDTGA
jgi:ergothioneine biosynthesis protein EgtB